MKTNCGIIRDLLPLYAESLCTQESKTAVEEHLRVCESCTAELEQMQQKNVLTPIEAVPMKTLSRKLGQKQRRMITLAIVLVIFFCIIAFHHITDRHYLDYSKNLINVLPTADGSGLVLAPKSGVKAVLEVQNFPSPEEVPSYPSPESEGYTEYHVSMYKSREAFHQNQTHFITLNNDVKTRVYFIAPDKTAVLLYGEKSSDNFIVLPRLALNYYFMFAGAVFITIGIIWLLLKILPSTRNIPTSFTWLAIAAFPLAYMISHIAIKGFNTTSWNFMRDFKHILIATIFAYLSILLGISVIKNKKKMHLEAG